MDRFELNWPGVDAQLLTDGWRCRIVWRQKAGRQGHAMGGTIDNNVQCVRRLADSLSAAPNLLGALRARGHGRLAEQVERAAEQSPVAEQSRVAEPDQAAGPANTVEPAATGASGSTIRSGADRVADWLAALDGHDAHAAADLRRARTWIELDPLDGAEESWLLKIPTPRGKPEWVLKRVWPAAEKRKPEYVTAEHFRGIAAWLVTAGADTGYLRGVLERCPADGHAELETAHAAAARLG